MLKRSFLCFGDAKSHFPLTIFLTLGTLANDSAGWDRDQECQNTMGRGCSVILPTWGGGGGNAGNPLSMPVFLRFPTQFCELRRFYMIWFSQFRGLRHLSMHLDCISGVGYPKKELRAVANSAIVRKLKENKSMGREFKLCYLVCSTLDLKPWSLFLSEPSCSGGKVGP